jgi:ubiquinone/menaquinone biosynthesis C-methylase UbiE
MNRQYVPELAASYNRGAHQYRLDDEIEARSENHHRLGGNLRRICQSFRRPIRVMEIGCGTGRYFHWLRNVQLLVGTDISEEMLKEARHPLQSNEVHIEEIRLVQGDIYEMSFEPEDFDFIYCLGVFGYGASVTGELCQKLHRWLAPAGRVYFNAIETPPEGRNERIKRAIKSAVLPRLPSSLQRRFASRHTGVPLIRHTRCQIEQAMEAGGFSDFSIGTSFCDSPLWRGVHLECLGAKGAVTKLNGIDDEAVSRNFVATD